jgi:hypothetical protein
MHHLMEATSGDKAIVALASGLALLVAIISRYLLFSGPLDKFPSVQGQKGSYPKRVMTYVRKAGSLYYQGYKDFKGAIFRITTIDGMC